MKDVKAIFMVALCLIVAFLGLYFQFFSGQSHKDTQENRQENRQEEIQEEKEKKPENGTEPAEKPAKEEELTPERFGVEDGWSGYFTEMVDSVSEMIAPYVDKDPSKFCTSEEFQKGISTLKSFCLLRAQSVSGQLNGTVPSTEEGQKAEDAALVDDQGIVISDMGSMR